MRIFKIEKNRKIIILLIMLLVVPTIISGSIWTFHGKFTVGIVLDEGAELKYAEDAKDGLLLHGEYFEPIILDERFDSSGVKTLYQFYLSKDFNDPEFTRPLRTKYGLHAILIVTEHPLRNWIDNPKVAWGEADPKSASAVMTVFPFRTQSIRDKEARMHNAIHEVSHLLGYMHESLDKDCVMQYAGNGLNYSFYKGFERPYRVTFAPLVLGNDIWAAFFIINSILTLIFLPYAIAVILLIRKVLSRYDSKFAPNMINLSRDICLSYFAMMVTGNMLLGLLGAIAVGILAILLIHFASIAFKREKSE